MTRTVKEFVKSLKLKGRTLDVGSLDVNGNVREFFDKYIGLDMTTGKNVDIVAKGNHLPFKSNLFDNVLCLETLEHDDRFWETIPEMKRVLKIGGRIVITVPNFMCELHAFPNDYWRFSEEAVKSLLGGFKKVKIETKFNDCTLMIKRQFISDGMLQTNSLNVGGLPLEAIEQHINSGHCAIPITGTFAHGIKLGRN